MFAVGPANYNTSDKTTLVSSRRNAPAYSMVPKQIHGGFCEDLAKVSSVGDKKLTILNVVLILCSKSGLAYTISRG